jgi:dTDP-4-amino-4,6-dideoxygalactose transaminase
MTFAATANAIIHAGLKPAFVDIDPATLNIDPARLAERLTPHTAAVVVVHYAGNACDMAAILHAAGSRPVIEDCAHAIETEYQGVAAGLLGVAGAFSFYPNKNITTGEGGLVLTSDAALAERVRRLRLHGLNRSTYDRAQTPQLSQYDITDAGYKANMNEIQAAIGLCQLQNVAAWHARRCWIAAQYSAALEPTGLLAVVKPIANTVPAWHLFTVQLHLERLSASRDAIAAAIISRGIGLTVAYQPLHTFSYYRRVWGTHVGDFPVAEAAYPRLLSLPIYPALTDEQVYYVCETVRDVLLHHKR